MRYRRTTDAPVGEYDARRAGNMTDNPAGNPTGNPVGEQADELDPIRHPGGFSLIYESKDRRFCLFEDADGHLTAVRASKLA